jgi:signal transduction histidine kinase
MYLFSIKLFEVKRYDYLISSFIDADGMKRSLPVSHFSNNTGAEVAVSGEFLAFVAERDEQKVIYIPYLIGSLKLSVNGVTVYHKDDNLSPISALSSNSAIIEIPWANLNGFKSSDGIFRLTFELKTDRSGFGAVSNIYIGDLIFFQENQRRISIYHDTIRTAIDGGQLTLLLLFISSAVTRKLTVEIIAPTIILLFFLASSIGKYSSLNSGLVFIGQLSVSLAPLAILALLKLFNDIRLQDLKRPYSSTYVCSGAAMFLPAVAAISFGFNITAYNTFVSAPILLVGCTTLALLSIREYFNSLRLEIGLWSITLVITLCGLIYDILFRFGFGLAPVNFGTFTMSIFCISICVTFIQLILTEKLDLADANLKMQKALDHQSDLLETEFKRFLRLKTKALVAEEQERLTAELHDGVLTYLSMINTLSEKNTNLVLERINILSRNALNEIRIILEARQSDVYSLTIALGALRTQLVDPLIHMGIKVEWSTHALLEQGATEPKVILEIIRIVQEGIHNAVIRAKCTALNIVASRHDNGFSITITNKGGLSFTEKHRKGLGISSMTNRAASIGATLEIQPINSGAILTLTVPILPSAKQAAATLR